MVCCADDSKKESKDVNEVLTGLTVHNDAIDEGLEESQDLVCMRYLDDVFAIAEPLDNAVVVPGSTNVLIRVKLPCCTRRFELHVFLYFMNDLITIIAMRSHHNMGANPDKDYREVDCVAFEDLAVPLNQSAIGEWQIYVKLLKDGRELDIRSVKIHACKLKSAMTSIWLPFTRMHGLRMQNNQPVQTMQHQSAVLPSYFKDPTANLSDFPRCAVFIADKRTPWPNLDTKQLIQPNRSNDYHGCARFRIGTPGRYKSSHISTRNPRSNSSLHPRVHLQLEPSAGLGNQLFSLAAAYAFSRRHACAAP